MIVQVMVHLERVDGAVVYWAESPDVPGFTATADSLSELRIIARQVLREHFGDRGVDDSGVRFSLVARAIATANSTRVPASEGSVRAVESASGAVAQVA